MNWVVIFDLAQHESEIKRLEEQAAGPAFWNDSEQAQRIMQDLARIRDEVEPWKDLARRVSDLRTLVELAGEESDPAPYEAEISTELGALRDALDQLEVRTLLSGPHDRSSAILE